MGTGKRHFMWIVNKSQRLSYSTALVAINNKITGLFTNLLTLAQNIMRMQVHFCVWIIYVHIASMWKCILIPSYILFFPHWTLILDLNTSFFSLFCFHVFNYQRNKESETESTHYSFSERVFFLQFSHSKTHPLRQYSSALNNIRAKICAKRPIQNQINA